MGYLPQRSLKGVSRVAQWKRAGPITQRSVDRNHALLEVFAQKLLLKLTIFIQF